MTDPEAFGLAYEERALYLLRVLNECAQDTAMVDFGLQVLSEPETEWQVEFLRSYTAKISERITLLVNMASNEFLIYKDTRNDQAVVH